MIKYILILSLVLLSCREKKRKPIYSKKPLYSWEQSTSIPFGYYPEGYRISASCDTHDTICWDSYGKISTAKWLRLQFIFDSIRYANFDGYNMRQYDSIQKGIKLIDTIGHHQNILINE